MKKKNIKTASQSNLENDVGFRLEQPEVPLIPEAPEGRVEEVGGEGGHHAAEEGLPGELHVPEGGHLLHGEEKSAHRCAESRGDAGSDPSGYKISP